MGVEVCHNFKIKPKLNDAGVIAMPQKRVQFVEKINGNLKFEPFGFSNKIWERILARQDIYIKNYSGP